ncbi:glycosyltransferase family 4 protein [Xylanibacter oryzae]|uniref:glycosyltransferase family 4 protein n=1 Tax=Xylanibacter oryzae TaxID=185293 RepID=UPI0004BBF4E8|nr:glycosyltransferase family 4 protein [Xylanibacter oryzae]
MRILFLIYHGFSEHSGISKKIKYQIKGLRDLGHKVFVCYYDYDNSGNKVRYINDDIINNYGKNFLSGIIQRIDFSKIVKFTIENRIEFVYARSFINANPFTINLFRKFKEHGIKSVIEIPTYPYDHEYDGSTRKEKFELVVDKLFRKQLAKQTDRIITFTDNKEIFGQKTCCISNGIDFDSIPLKLKKDKGSNQISFIGVAEIQYWHGFDRFIHGIGEYYKNGGTHNIKFHIVGGITDHEMHGSHFARGFKDIANEYNINDKIIYHGLLFGKELDNVFNECDFAVGSLARHRCNISEIKTLKNREYAARGIPFIYSETDSDFDKRSYIIKAPADESAIDIKKTIEFYEGLNIAPKDIRNSIKNLSWKNQMGKIVNEILNE